MSESPKRILVVEASGRGFLNHYSHALALGLHLCGEDVHLLTGVRDELYDWDVPYPKQSCLEKGRRGWRCVRRYIQHHRPDVVHFQWVDNPFLVWRLVRWMQRRGIRVVYTPHNVLPHEKRWLLMPVYRLLYRCMDSVIARDLHIAWALEELLDVHKETIEHIPGSPNFLALQSDDSMASTPGSGKPPGEKRLLFFGHGSARKGLDMLLELIAGNDWPSRFHLLLAGEGVLTHTPLEIIERARTKIRISTFDEYIAPREVADLFRDADLLLMPYIKQCKSPLLDLAAALKLPVLKSDRVHGADFREHIHGLSFPHDDPEELLSLLRFDDWIEQSSNNLQRLDSPEASMKRLALGHNKLYRKLLSNESNITIENTTLAQNKISV